MIADIVLVIIMLLCVFLGYKRGLIKVAVKILGFVISVALAFILYTPISNYIIENTDAVASIKNVIDSKIYGAEEETGNIEKENQSMAATLRKLYR